MNQSTFNQSGQHVVNQINVARDLIIGPQSPIPSPFQYPLPERINDFTGRTAAVERLKHMLTTGDMPYIGLVGMGGIGKTWLAIRIANELQTYFTDGILWADFEKLSVEEALRQFAAPFGVQDEIAKLSDTESMAKRLREVIGEKQILVIINDATSVEDTKLLLTPKFSTDEGILAARTLITTRDRDLLLDIEAEIYEVQPWTIEEATLFLTQLLGEERIAREVESARTIVAQVGGLPLAIRIIGSALRRQRRMTLKDYEGALQNESERIRRIKERKDRQLNVEASIELSYGLLDSNVQALLVSLAIFQGPDFDAEAVVAATQYDRFDVLEGLGQLHSLSLIEEGLGERNQIVDLKFEDKESVRYRLHPLIKSFALDRLEDLTDIDIEGLHHRLAHYYGDLAEQNRAPKEYTNLDLDWQNIMASLQWAHEHQEYPLVIRGALALTHYHLGIMGYMDLRGHWNDAKQVLSWALEGMQHQNTTLDKVLVLTSLGGFEVRQANYTAAKWALEEADRAINTLPATEDAELQRLILAELIARAYLQDDRSISTKRLEDAIANSFASASERILQQVGFLKIQLAGILTRSGAPERSIALAKEGLMMLPEEASTARLNGLMHLGNAHQHISSPEKSSTFFQEAYTIAQEVGDVSRLAMLWTNMAWDETRRGDMAKAVAYQKNALAIFSYIGDRYFESGLGINIGANEMRMGNENAATEHFIMSIELAERYQFLDVEAMAKSNLAGVLIYDQQYTEATTVLDRAKAICKQLKFDYLMSTILRQQAEVALGLQNYTAGISLIDEATTLATETNDKAEIGICYRVKGNLLLALGKDDEALQLWDDSLHLLKEADLYEYGNTLYTMAILVMQNQEDLRESIVDWLTASTTIYAQYMNQTKVSKVQQLLEALQ